MRGPSRRPQPCCSSHPMTRPSSPDRCSVSAAGSPRSAEPRALTDIRCLLDYEPEHHQLRDNVRAFGRGRILPFRGECGRTAIIDGSLFTAAGKHRLLGFSVPEKLGGPAVDGFRYNAIVVEEEGQPRRCGRGGNRVDAAKTSCCPISASSALTSGRPAGCPAWSPPTPCWSDGRTGRGKRSHRHPHRRRARRRPLCGRRRQKRSFPTAATATCSSWPRGPRRTSTRG